MMRLNKYIARSGYCSRRKADELIFSGDVSIDGEICTNPAVRVNDQNTVEVLGERIRTIKSYDYIMLNKPIGYMSSLRDPHYDRFVLDLIPKKYSTVYPVGRLDVDSHGLLLLTNDGDMTYKLTHPKNNISKIYHVKTNKPLNDQDINIFSKGVLIDDKYKCTATVIPLDNEKNNYKVIIDEGRNRQIRKMFSALGYDVIDLMRIAIEDLSIGSLKTGEYRLLSEKEINYLEEL